MIESASCGSGLVSTKSECEAAATALDLSVKTATDLTLAPARVIKCTNFKNRGGMQQTGETADCSD